MQKSTKAALAAGLSGCALGALYLGTPAALAISEADRQFFDNEIRCIELFFSDPAAHARDCPNPSYSGGYNNNLNNPNGNSPPPCEVIKRPEEPDFQDSDIDLKPEYDDECIDELTGLTIYRFRYEGDDGFYYGVMAQDLLADARYASLVTVGADGYYQVDYGSLGLNVPDPDAMRAAGSRARAILGPKEPGL